MGGDLWAVATIMGPIILIVVIGYALWTRRQLTATERMRQKDAVQDIYRGGEGGPSAPHTPSAPKPEKDG